MNCAGKNNVKFCGKFYDFKLHSNESSCTETFVEVIKHFYLILNKKKPNWIRSMESLSVTLTVTTPRFLGMSPESRFQADELAKEDMGNHKWNSAKMQTALSSTYLHRSS